MGGLWDHLGYPSQSFKIISPLWRVSRSHPAHEAEGGTSTLMLLARSRHASVRSLERYARPGVDAVARHVAQQDPAARRRG